MRGDGDEFAAVLVVLKVDGAAADDPHICDDLWQIRRELEICNEIDEISVMVLVFSL